MRTLGTRHVHPDFHTGGSIPNVGASFDKVKFQKTLLDAHVNSTVVFAKCLHGYCYFPTENGVVHPSLPKDFDLLGQEIAAAHEVGIAAPIYITVGWSAVDMEMHPEWRRLDKEGKPTASSPNFTFDGKPDDPYPINTWVDACPSGEYLRRFYALEQEIVNRYDVDGLFVDIMYWGNTCYCKNCLEGMRRDGLNPDNEEDAKAYYRKLRLDIMQRSTEILHEKHPDATIFFNTGGADVYHPEYHEGQTHFELEHLPSVWQGGFNTLPARISYLSRYGKEISYMTGKFHNSWGEVGGYKNPDALRYEMMTAAMYGAKCCIGDHLLPNGVLDEETYRIVGHVYETVEKCEPWLWPSNSTATLAVYLTGDKNSDQGLYNMLLESHIDFDLIDQKDDLEGYKALILADCVTLTDEALSKIKHFIANGGAVLFTGKSALRDGRFLLDAGAEYLGEGEYKQDYFVSTKNLQLPYGNAPVICYESAQRTRVTDGEILAKIREPWFDRTYAHYSDFLNTPFRDTEAAYPACVRKGNVIYMAHPLCRLYCNSGMPLFREMLIRALRLIYTPECRVALPTEGRIHLIHQMDESRYVLHTAYACPVRRGNVTMIEDIVPVYDIPVEIDLPEKITAVTLQPQNDSLPFEQENSTLRFNIPKIYSTQIVELIYEKK